MDIKGNDFILTPINDSTPIYDLELLYEIRPKGKEPRLEFKTVAYGLSLEQAIKKIAQYRISRNHIDESLDIQQYFKEFKEELDSLKPILNFT